LVGYAKSKSNQVSADTSTAYTTYKLHFLGQVEVLKLVALGVGDILGLEALVDVGLVAHHLARKILGTRGGSLLFLLLLQLLLLGSLSVLLGRRLSSLLNWHLLCVHLLFVYIYNVWSLGFFRWKR